MYSFGYGNDRPIPRLGAFNPLNIEGLSLYMNKNLGVNTKLAADFNGTTQYLSSDSTDFDFTTESFTLGGWFKWTSTTDDFSFFNKWKGSGDQRGFICYKNNSDKLSFRISDNGTALTSQLTTTASYAINTWHYVAFVKDAVNDLIKISVNGQAFSSAVSTNSVFNSNEDLIIGFTYAANYLDGAADGLNIYNKALSTAELKAIYNLGNGIAYDKLPTLVGEQYAIGQYFNGTTDAFNIDAVLTPLASTTTGTIEFYIKMNTIGSTSRIISFGDTDIFTEISVYVNNAGRVGTFVRDSGTIIWQVLTDSIILNTSDYFKITVVQNGVSPEIYINDVLVAQSFLVTTDKTIWFNDIPLLDNGRIACNNNNSSGNLLFTDCTIQNLKIYSDATQTTLVTNYPMNNVEGADQVDIVGGYNATPIGSPYSTLASVDNTTIGDMKTNLISWWELNEASGTRYDSVLASANNLTDNNSVGYALGKIQEPTEVGEAVSQWVDQSPNMYVFSQDTVTAMPLLSANSVDFDGVDDNLSLASANVFGSDTSGIVFFNGYFDNTSVNRILGYGDLSDNNVLIRFGVNTGGKLSLQSKNGTPTPLSDIQSTDTIANGSFFYGWISSNGSSYSMSLNGVVQTISVASGSDNGDWFSIVPTVDSLSIGSLNRPTQLYGVTKASKIIYSNANLSSSAIAKIDNFMSVSDATITSFNKTLCSYYFNGSNKYLTENGNTAVNDLVSGSGSVFSLRVVFRRLSTGAEFLTSNWDTSTNRRSYALNFRGVDSLRFQFSTVGTDSAGNFTTNTVFNDTLWHEVVFTYNNGVVTCYVDGVSDAGVSTTIPTTIFDNGLSNIYGSGNVLASPLPFNGYINQVAWTTDIITSLEATALNNSGSPRIASDILDNMYLEYIFDNDTFDGTNWAVIDDISTNNAVSANINAVDKDCNENPY